MTKRPVLTPQPRSRRSPLPQPRRSNRFASPSHRLPQCNRPPCYTSGISSRSGVVMPTRRWMYIAPISIACVVAELTIMFGQHWEAMGGLRTAPEDLNGKFYVFVALMVGQAGLWGYLGSLV